MMKRIREILRNWLGVNDTFQNEMPMKSETFRKVDVSISSGLEDFLKTNYEFRYNVLTEQAEVRRRNHPADSFRAVSQRVANTLCLEARDEGINCWDKDVMRLLNSERMADYHPFLSYMENLPCWDGVDRVTPLAERVSEEKCWVEGFHKWMLGVAAQWSGRINGCANAVAPLLVSSRQGMRKSTFCQLLMPESLREHYTDSYDLNAQGSCEQKLALFGLINLDEFDKLSSRKQPLLKNLMQMTELHYRKAHRVQYSHLPRMASFIGTSNRKDLLTDPTGSRRFLCVEVMKKLDCTPLEHKQLFSQLKTELDSGKRYWFTSEEEKELMEHNYPYSVLPPLHDVFLRCYRLPKEGEEYELQAPGEMFGKLAKDCPKEMRGMNLNRFGRMLVSMGVERVHTVEGNKYKVVTVA